MTASDREFLSGMVDLMPSNRPPRLISEYVQGRRRMPNDTPFPGMWDNALTPYLVEPMDNMSPFSTTKETYLLKGAQFGATALSENVLGYWMDPNPTSILYVSATQDMIEKWVDKRLEPMITSLGFRHKMTMDDALGGAKTRRSGDKAISKRFMGGSLDLGSANSAPSVQSDTKRVLVLDEIDRAIVSSGKESWIENAKARTITWGNRARILGMSTPDTEESSAIWKLYNEGDRRQWFMPCPHCDGEITLSLSLEEFGQRFVPILNEGTGKLRDVAFICPTCSKRILDSIHKDPMIRRGLWRPTGDALRENVRSYHMPTAMSTLVSWTGAVYPEYEKKKGSPRGVRSFVNLFLGWPFKEKGRGPKMENTTAMRGDYPQGQVPKGVVYLTAGCDVQTGKDARVEVVVIGHGFGYRTWIIEHLVFMGDTSTPDGEGWVKFQNWHRQSYDKYRQGDLVFPVQLALIDEGDGNVTATVRQVCSSLDWVFSCKGEQRIQNHEKRALEGDKAGAISEVAYRHSQIGTSGQWFYRIGTNHYKSIIYQNLEVERNGMATEHQPQSARFMDFPSDLTDTFFAQLFGEEKLEDGSYHPVKPGQRVEALDCVVYGICAGDVWLHRMTNVAQERFARANPTVPMRMVIENITTVKTLHQIARNVGVDVEDVGT